MTEPIALAWRVPRLLSARSAMALMVVGGCALRLVQYLGNPDLWVDELAIADNVISRPAWVLLTARLMDDQVAPPGFLLISRLAVVLFNWELNEKGQRVVRNPETANYRIAVMDADGKNRRELKLADAKVVFIGSPGDWR